MKPFLQSALLAACLAPAPALLADDEPASAPPSVAPAPAAASSEVLAEAVIDRVWAGHPVTFAFLTERGHQFIAYYDAERRITVASRRLDETAWKRFQPEGVHLPARGRPSNVTGWDSHNYLALALDKDGYLHLSGNMHNDPLIYFRSTRPLDIESIERVDRMTGRRENNTTYPVFFTNRSGELFFRYRDGGSGNGADIYNVLETTSRAWVNLLSAPLLDGQGKRNAYAMNPTLGPDGRFHLVWMWRESPDCATTHRISYARSADFMHWEKSDGTPLRLPITLDAAEAIDPSPVRQGMINMTFNLGFDSEKRPVAVYHRYDSAGKSQVYAARPAQRGAPWDIVQISDWDFRWQFGGGGSVNADVILGAPVLLPDNSLRVDYATTRSVGEGRWHLDGKTLRPIGALPPPSPVLPDSLAKPLSGHPGMEVQTLTSRADGRRWVLRWETLPRNRDQPRNSAPPATELRVYELPDAATNNAIRIGS